MTGLEGGFDDPAQPGLRQHGRLRSIRQPLRQPNVAGQPSYGQPNPHDPGNQYGQSNPCGQPNPYGQTNPYGQPDPYQGGGYPQSGQQGYDGQPGWGMQQTPAKRPAWRTIVGWIFVALTGLFTLSAITQLASGRLFSGGSAAYMAGQLIGLILVIGGPALVAWLMLRKK